MKTSLSFLVALAAQCSLPTLSAMAHPGSGIVVDQQGNVYFTHTGRGAGKIDAQGNLTYFHKDTGGHFIAGDAEGSFSSAAGNRLFERITPSGAKPTLLYASGGAPFVVNRDGNLYYGSGFPGGDDTTPGGFTLTRMSPDGKKTLFAPELKTTLEKLGEAVTGLAAGPNGTLFVACPSAILNIDEHKGWTLRVRKLSSDGKAAILLSVAPDDRPASRADSFFGSKAGDEREAGGMKLCWCPAGRFIMGSPRGEPERRPGEDQVEVTLSKGFWMGKYEVTQGQWKRVIGEFPGRQPAHEGDDFPVVEVNYAEVQEFCRKLSQSAHAAGDLPREWEFRLPTEAQWEYACRAGTTTATSFGDKLSSKQANVLGKPYNGAEQGPSLNRATKVGSYPANAWGLHDMHGNVVEWCRDWYHEKMPGGNDPDLSSVKGTRNRDGTYSRSRRGSAWTDDGWASRSALRQRFEPERRADHIGFRVVAVQP